MLTAVCLQDNKRTPAPPASSGQHTQPDNASAMEAVANNGVAAAMRVLQQAEERLKELQVQEARLTVSTADSTDVGISTHDVHIRSVVDVSLFHNKIPELEFAGASCSSWLLQVCSSSNPVLCTCPDGL